MKTSLALLALCAAGQVPQGLPRCFHSTSVAVDALLDLSPNEASERYITPEEATVGGLQSAMTALLRGDGDAAFAGALRSGYWLCIDDGVVFGAPAIPGVGRSLFAWRPGEAAPLIIEAPHPHHDLGTGGQAVEIFEAVKARVLIVSGTHRCASAEGSGCDGESGACEGDATAGYRLSDMAHAVGTVFMGAHVFFSEAYPDDLVVSLHGMADDGISISNGTELATTSSSAVARLATALAVAFPEERVTVCNAYPGAAVDRRLCGTTNVQGRHLNGLGDQACTETATTASERFLHLEQSTVVRGQSERVADALDQVLGAW